MTTQLTVHTKATDTGNRFDTYWTTGSKQGVITTSLGHAISDDAAIIAELSALHHLLSHKDILGEGRAGNNVTLNVSFGAIRKLALGNTGKRHLFAHGSFLLARYAEAKICVSKDTDWINLARATNRRDSLFINDPLPETLDISGFGRVGVSYHIIERMMERANYSTIAAAWHHLRRMLSGGQFAEVKLPPSIAEKKNDKHGSTGLHIRTLTEPWHFVIAQGTKRLNDAMPVLVTAYVRP